MGNKVKHKRPAKRRFYQDKQKHMIEVSSKKRRLESTSATSTSHAQQHPSIYLHILENVPQDQEYQETAPPERLENVPQDQEYQETAPPERSVDLQQQLMTEKSTDTSITETIHSGNDISALMDDEDDYNLHTTTTVNQYELPELKVTRRIVNVSHFFNRIKEMSSHGPLSCDVSCIELINEKQIGLMSKFTFFCKMCKRKFFIDNDADDENYLPLNNCAVAGIISIGGGRSQLEEFSAALNLPLISNKTYQETHDVLSKNWRKVAQDSMDRAAEKERNIAILKGRISANGTPIIDVIADGCYSKRSYKTNYSSLSGAGAIIGKETGEILYLGVRNKYCYTCERAEKKKETVKEHVCFKNYSGPSSGMETDIIVEGFKTSIETHNLIYGRLISDGDSSTYNKIKILRPYQSEGISVEKIECRNHLLRNFCNKLRKLKTDTHYPIKHRKLINKTKIKSLRLAVTDAIAKNKNDECPEVENLFNDINLAHHHAFGNHSSCKSHFCKEKDVVQPRTDDFFISSLWQRICVFTQNLAGHARSLIHDVDSNIVERYHSVVAKFVGGKRLNFCLKDSYTTRCIAAAASFNTKKGLSRLYKSIVQGSPKGKLKMIEERRIKQRNLNKKYPKKKRRLMYSKKDPNYGESCQKPDMPTEILKKMKNDFLESLKKTDNERDQIQKKTILQSQCSEWIELRRSLLTASNFGQVIKKKANTKCANIVKKIMYGSNLEHVASIKHGRINEQHAIQQLAQQEGLDIEPCGLYIDKDMPFLGASPDGVSGDTIIEIKCPITANRLGLEEAVKKKKIDFWKINKKGEWVLNKNHSWFYQVQGQLHVTRMNKCLFAVWSNDQEALKTEIITKDNGFWSSKMKNKLEIFYIECMLPEIVDPRFTRNLPIREPSDNGTRTQAVTEPDRTLAIPLTDTQTSRQVNDSKPTCSRYLELSDF